ncbi:MAG: S46 family peptidase [Flavobacteriaceae bacterium]|nr:S46 family peptidase [Flavobacteriaceae bacterium]
MKKLFLLLSFTLSFFQVKADEGMWLMMLIKRLNGVDMQKQGLKLTPEEIYAVNNSSLKDAIVSFGGYCTGEIVSKEGLIFTNHHCGYGSIAALSTPEKDHLTNGFWAKNKKEELHAKDLYVRFLVRMGDTTERINAKLNHQMSAQERHSIIEKEMKAIEKENSENGKYTVVVRSFFNGNEFYYFVYQDYKDIRLVGTPTNSIGKFGGDTDNWEWPRHTGDFAVFRVYGDANGNPAEYSINNVPLKPKHHLPISLKGIKANDFTMIMGYPGRTNRYLTSFGIQQLITKDYPAWVDASKVAMDAMKKHMDKDQAIKLDYASSYSSTANYWKNRAGTIEAIKKNGTIEAKKELEKVFQAWAEKPENKALYGNVLKEIEEYYAKTNERNIEANYLRLATRRASLTTIPYTLGNKLLVYASQDANGQASMKEKLTNEVESIYEDFHYQVEADLLNDLLSAYKNKVEAKYQLPIIRYTKIQDLVKSSAQSIFAKKENVLAFINNPNKTQLEEDALYQFSGVLVAENQMSGAKYAQDEEIFEKNSRLFLDGLRKSHPNKKFYPDANSTMRLTYGKVNKLPVRKDRKYHGVKDNYYTDLKGMVAKYVKGDEEFDLPKRLLDLYKKKDYGQYKDKKGYLPVNFLSDNDITGGNSGSPILNAEGHLIGIAFDGNSEALSGDIVFELGLQRTINVDVRFVLWVIDKFAGAKHLIDEMTIVK